LAGPPEGFAPRPRPNSDAFARPSADLIARRVDITARSGKCRGLSREKTMSYAVIRTGGKQYRVSPGARLTVEKLVGEPGQQVEFPEVLLRGNGESVEIGAPLVEGAAVRAVILEQDRGPRILVFKKKRRKNYRRRMGHRQYETTVQITSVD